MKGNVCSGTAHKETSGYGGEWGDRQLADKHYADPDGREAIAAWDCHPDCPVGMLDEQSGERGNNWRADKGLMNSGCFAGIADSGPTPKDGTDGPRGYCDTGGASRFFLNLPPELPIDGDDVPRMAYIAKASRRERNAGLDGLAHKRVEGMNHSPREHGEVRDGIGQANHHPCVKPVALMRYLVRLVTQPDGLVLDPFAGSGSTGVACVLEGFDFLGLEQDPDYVAIAERRIAHVQQHGERWLTVRTETRQDAPERTEPDDLAALPLFAQVAD